MTPAQTTAFESPCLDLDEILDDKFSEFVSCEGGFWTRTVSLCVEGGGKTYWFAILRFHEAGENCPSGPLPFEEWPSAKLEDGTGFLNELLAGVGDIDGQVLDSSEKTLFLQRPASSEELSELTKRETSKES